jgi:polyhydroxybutyrate depolymerase
MVTLTVDGIKRTFFVHLPSDYDAEQANVLLIALHPGASSGLAMAALTGFDHLADEEGYIVVYPNSMGVTWNTDTKEENNADDVGFTEALIDHMVSDYNVDMEQVFLTGFHDGGLMAYRLACEIPERFASVAVVGPLMFASQRDACASVPAAPLNMFIMHGSDDTLYQTETYIYQPMFSDTEYEILGVEDTLAVWTDRNGCEAETAGSVNELTNTRLYSDCKDEKQVALYTLEGGKMNWPRGGDYKLNIFGIDASQMVIDFFQGNDDWAVPQNNGEEEARTYEFYVPGSYDPENPTPVVIALHGRFGTGAGTANWTGINPIAEKNNFVAVYPDGLPTFGAETPLDTGWNYIQNIPGYKQSGPDDVAFLHDLIDDLSIDLNIDQQRIYIFGISNGGFMVHNLACNDPQRYAAFADVIGSAPDGLGSICQHTVPVPMLMMHGTLDDNVLWDGRKAIIQGQEIYTTFPVLSVVSFWAVHNGCDLDQSTAVDLPQSGMSPGTSVRVLTLDVCNDDAAVVLYGIVGGGHNWPGSATSVEDSVENRINMDINPAEVLWEFFSKYTRTEEAGTPAE